jgi:hypothetical protein
MKCLAAFAAAFAWAACSTLVLAPTACAAVPAERVERWRQDLAFVADSLPRGHANLFHDVSRVRFGAALDSLAERVPRLDHDEITVELARIIALVHDGHTRLTFPFDSTAGFFTGHTTTAAPRVPGLVFRHLPVRLREFADGLYVVKASPEQRALLGGRVVGLGDRTIDEARSAVEPTIQRDNDQQVRDLMPTWLVVPEILHARGVTRDRDAVRIVVQSPGGARVEAMLHPDAVGVAPSWVDARDPGPLPWPDREPSRAHWWTLLPKTTAIYARYREVRDDGPCTVEAFASAMLNELAEGRGDRLILDLRGNVGGNGYLNRPLLHGIIGAPLLRRPGSLFVLADRGTFSAAMMLLADLETHTPAIIVGEKTGGRPNGYGDSRRVRLPNTGLTVRASTLYWQTTDPRDTRDGITPHVQAEPTFADWKAGRDPVLDSTLAMIGPASDFAGDWAGIVSVDQERVPIRLKIGRASGGGRVVGIEAPDLGVPAGEGRDVKVESATLSFVVPGDQPLAFRLRARRTTLVGTVRFQGSLLPLVARR